MRSYEEISAELALWREKRAECDLVVASVSHKVLVVTQKRAKINEILQNAIKLKTKTTKRLRKIKK